MRLGFAVKKQRRIYAAQQGFTLIEMVLVLVVIVVISGVALPYFAGSYRGSKLRTAAHNIERIARYGRGMSILRGEMLTLVIDYAHMDVYLGGPVQTDFSGTDGEINQDVLKRLGYLSGDRADRVGPGIEKEIRRNIPDGLAVREFDKDARVEDEPFGAYGLVRFYPNGQCERFELVLEDQRHLAIRIESDPVSGKVRSGFIK